MQKRNFTIGLLALCLAISLLLTTTSIAHTPLCSCYDNGDGTITCDGGFTDGSSAAGVEVRIEDKNGKVLIKGVMDEDSEFTGKKPSVPYKVIFDVGPGHVVEVDGNEIVE